MAAITVEQALQTATAHCRAGEVVKAAAICQEILASQPEQPGAVFLLGVIAAATGRSDDAVRLILQAIARCPDNADYRANLGVLYGRLGRFDEAVECLLQALTLEPDSADNHLSLGLVRAGQGRLGEAIESYRQALALRPDFSEAYNNLGNALAETGETEQAATCFQRALAIRPTYASPHYNLGNVFAKAEAWDDAIASFRRALELQPQQPMAHNNLGNALLKKGAWNEAIPCFRRALTLKPDYVEAHVNLGNAFGEIGRWEEAVECYQRAITLKPGLAEAHGNLAFVLLRLGRHREGWREYEWRIRANLAEARPGSSAPEFPRASSAGQALVVLAEQGFGDTLQFMRYVPLVRERSGASRVIVECQAPLVRLLAESGGWEAEIVERQNSGNPTTPLSNWYYPLLSLPLALALYEPLAMSGPYLQASPTLRAQWRQRLLSGAALRVGLVWAGNPRYSNDRRRSIDAAKYVDILRVPGANVYSLQVEPRGSLPRPLADGGLIDLAEYINDFADTAALMMELDLVISVDTAVAHLAGALGKPVWILLPFVPDWRWGFEREDTPWYPSMRLFRQPKPGDWDSVIQRVTEELRTIAARHSPLLPAS